MAIDPDYALAHAVMGECCLIRSTFGNMPGREAFPDFWLAPCFQSFASWQMRDGDAAIAAIEMLERARAEHNSPFAWIRALCEQLDLIADDRIRLAMARLSRP